MAPARRGVPARLYALILLMIVLWALNFIIGKIALREIPPLLAGGLRTSIAGLLIIPVYAWEGRRSHVHRWKASDLPTLLGLGLAGVALNQLFFLLGLSRTSVAHAALVMGLTPILVLLLAALARQERITARKLAGMAVALAGVALLQLTQPKAGGATLLGDVFILLASLTFALFTVVGKHVTARHGAITVNTFAYVGGAVMLAPVTWWLGHRFDFTAVSAAAWASLLYMTLFPSLVCYLIYYYALTHIAASRLSMFSYLQPLIATSLAVPLLGESITSGLLAGGALVFAGVWVTERA